MPYADIRGVRLHYEDLGEGTPFLLLPGALGSGQSDFEPQLEALPQRGLRVIVPDPRGYGKSRPPEREFPSDFYQQDAHDFAALMETLGCSTYAVGGWSDGANASLLLTLAYPQRVTRMAVWGGNAYATQEDIDAYETTRCVADWAPRAAAPMRAMYGDDFQALWTRWCDAQQRFLKAGGDLCRDRLAEIACPTFLLHGGKDPLVPLFHARFLQQGIAGSRLHVFPDGRHDIHLYYADAFNELLVEFLLS
jgi:valacyclovir hydrolase